MSNLYANKFGHDNDNSYTSNNKLKDTDKYKRDMNLVFDMNIDDDKLEDIDDAMPWY